MTKTVTTKVDGLSDADRAAIGDFLTVLGWNTPMTASGEAERLKAVVDRFEAVRAVRRR